MAVFLNSTANPAIERAAVMVLDHERAQTQQALRVGAPTENQQELNPAEASYAVQYLDAYGYLPEALSDWKNISIEDILAALQTFQAWFGLQKTSKFSPQTLRAMQCLRCGCPDIVRRRHVEQLRMQAATAQGLPAWTKRAILYTVQGYVGGLPPTTQDLLIQKAFNAWTQYLKLEVNRAATGQRADILIGTGQGQGSNFDGPGGVLAWAYMPDGSDQQLTMRFDLAETWITDPVQRGILFLNVATHEFGHTLGLTHSQVSGALMAPYYNVSITEPQANDDIPRAVARYGARPTVPTIPPNPPDPPNPPNPPATGSMSIDWVGPAKVMLNGVRVL